ncbi:MAG: alpha/beta fold hydrolase [Pseudomonadota bacterium]
MSGSPERSYAPGPFGQIHYQDTGEGDITLLLASQAPATSWQFERAYPLFHAAGIRAVGIDTLGFGLSDAPPGPPSIADYATSIIAVMDHLGLEAAHLCGHHTGSMIITEAALSAPARIASLILAGPVPLTLEERKAYIDSIVAEERAYEAKADGSHLADMFVRRLPWVRDMPDALALCSRYTIRTLMGSGPFWYGHHAAFNYDHGEAMQRLAQPALILTNTGDMIYPLAELTRQLCPHFSYAELEGGGIDIVDQDPAGWVAAIDRYLRD